MTIWAKITTQFEGIHYYPAAPEEVSFLKHPHRHIFHVIVWLEQRHSERDVEYIIFKRWLTDFLTRAWGMQAITLSCESIALVIARAVQNEHPGRRVRVEVNEDGENGALVED